MKSTDRGEAGLFGRASISDGNPTPLRYFLSAGIGGFSPLAHERGRHVRHRLVLHRRELGVRSAPDGVMSGYWEPDQAGRADALGAVRQNRPFLPLDLVTATDTAVGRPAGVSG